MKTFLLKRRKILIVIPGLYGILWLLTATWGAVNVDNAFDREFAVGTTLNDRKSSIQRITMANIRSLEDPANKFPDNGLFRYRTRGFAIAPFIIIDEAAVVYAPLGGYGGRRLNLWLFGWTTCWPIQTYWAV